MTKPKSDSYAVDWPLWHADLLTVQPSRLDSLAYQRAGRSLGFQSVIIKTECASGAAREERRRLFVPYSPPLFDSLSLSPFDSSSLCPFLSLTLSLFDSSSLSPFDSLTLCLFVSLTLSLLLLPPPSISLSTSAPPWTPPRG